MGERLFRTAQVQADIGQRQCVPLLLSLTSLSLYLSFPMFLLFSRTHSKHDHHTLLFSDSLDAKRHKPEFGEKPKKEKKKKEKKEKKEKKKKVR